ncbi:MAG: VanZ family protein [Melioribacteraceae bacterium]|nr:VanZ family protein [Melioribacteraceae bacterium]
MQLSLLLIRLYNFLKKNKVLFVYFPLVIYWITIFIATSIPLDQIPQLFDFQDKLEHFAAYFILAILISFTFHFQEKYYFLKNRVILFAILTLTIYAAFDELHQLLIPGRVADITDWIADVIGGVLGIIFSNLFIKIGLTQFNIVNE